MRMHFTNYSCFRPSIFFIGRKPQRNTIYQTSSEGEKKNKNLNKYFIRLFCDWMCFCLAVVYGNISGPFINALTQWYPTLAQYWYRAALAGRLEQRCFVCLSAVLNHTCRRKKKSFCPLFIFSVSTHYLTAQGKISQSEPNSYDVVYLDIIQRTQSCQFDPNKIIIIWPEQP